jgi:predicted nucleic acid-binding protein
VILADTSAWVEFDRATGSPVDARITDLLRGADDQLAVTEPVIMEVLWGAVDEKRERELRSLLRRCRLLAFESLTDFEGAVRVSRRCRAQGVTPRRALDCMIAAVALRTSASLLALDRDLLRVATTVGIDLDVDSPAPRKG